MLAMDPLADCFCGARGACHCVALRGPNDAPGYSVCARTNPSMPFESSNPSTSLESSPFLNSFVSCLLPSYSPIVPILHFFHYYLGGCCRRGAGLVLDHSVAASSGATRRGGACEGGRPGGWPRLSRAPARTPPVSKEPLGGAVSGETGCWR